MSETQKKLLANLIVWLAFGIVLLGLNFIAPTTESGELNAVDALKRLLEPKLVALQVIAAILLLGVLAIFADKYSDRSEGQRLTGFLRLSTEETGSIVTNFASLLIVFGVLTHTVLLSLASATVLYIAAYFLLFKPTPRASPVENWTASYPRIPEVQEQVTFRATGSDVEGTISPSQGPDVGRTYVLRGSKKDRMLVGHFEAQSDGIQDKGVFVLRLDTQGEYYVGRIVYTHDSGRLINEEWRLEKAF